MGLQTGRLGQGLGPSAAVGAPAQKLHAPISAETHFRLRVPATSANLGPGYDTLGLALEWRDEIQVSARPRRDPEQPEVGVVVTGEGAGDLPADASHLVITAVERILAAKGYHLPDLDVRAHNTIPHSRGLGSSAAAIATAVKTADQLLPGGLSDDEQLQIGSRMEGHPDNYAPALRGGAAVSWLASHTSELVFRTAPLQVHSQLRCVLAVPSFTQSTQAARDLLPGSVPHEQAAKNSSRAALLVHAITANPRLLLDATEDYLHQEYRRQAFPQSMALVDELRAEGFAAVISGAGPAVTVLTDEAHAPEAAASIQAFTSQHPGRETFAASNLPIAHTGAIVESLR
ncbi:homoserine kinase [Nesterenkonia natronophila]|uniref:Homoserine kinase n=1 Tax=Nesterenkonia natronophila TaxID=2174932 RepID=A0A3A4EZU3_9MICC|nr:homoserine kinase [Nesterenkonia natronophila]RJN31403.1 homoserine kinase [Nesterenkonia natronophila]